MRELSSVSNPILVARDEHLSVVRPVVIDKTIHVKDEIVSRGTLVGKMPGGKVRAYAEAVVDVGGDFSTASTAFKLDVTSPLFKHFREGDVIESVGGVALGTIATLSKATGQGTLTANSAANLAAGAKVRVASVNLSIAGYDGRLLQDEVKMTGEDAPMAAYIEGFFVYDVNKVTADALTEMGSTHAVVVDGELRLK